jgi:hypothetical protein
MAENVIPGLKLIRHNAINVDIPDDPSFPFKLEGNFSPPELMNVTFILMQWRKRGNRRSCHDQGGVV